MADSKRSAEAVEERRSSRHRLLVALGRIAARVQRARTVEAVLENAGAGLLALGLRFAVASLRDHRLQLRFVAAQPEALAQLDELFGEAARGAVSPLSERGPLSALFQSDEGVFTEDLTSYAADFLRGRPELAFKRELAFFEASGFTRGIVTPLGVRGEPWGIFAVCGDQLSPTDSAALGLFGVQLGSALEVAESVESLARRNRDLAAIHSVKVGLDSDLANLLGQLQELAAGSTTSDCCSIYLLNDKQTELVMLGPPCGVEPSLSERFWRVPMARSTSGDVLQALKPRAMRVDAMPAESRTVLDAAGLHHVALVLLVANGHIEGLLSLGRMSDLRYDAVDLEAAQFLAGQVALQIENARLHADTQLRLSQLSLLFEVTRIGSEEREVAPLVDRVLAEVLKSVPVDLALVHFVTGDKLTLAGGQVSPFGGKGALDAFAARPLDDTSMVGRAALNRRTFASSVDELSGTAQRTAQAHGIRYLIATPLVAHGRLLGTLEVARCSKQPFSEQDEKLLESCATHLANAVERARLYDDLKRSYQALAHTQAELVKHERLAALGELAAVMAHEVRNPLGVIFNSIGSLRKLLQPTGDAGMLFDIVNEEAERLNRIIGDLLDFARPYQVRRIPVALDRVIAGAVEAASRVEAAPQVEISTEVPGAFPPLLVDEALLRQALVNLVVNAIQAMPRGGKLKVSASAERHGERQVARIDVSDQGVGISAQNTERIFQPFFTTKVSGTGLGLAVVKRIVDAHDGEVDVKSSLGLGTTFTIRIPAAP